MFIGPLASPYGAVIYAAQFCIEYESLAYESGSLYSALLNTINAAISHDASWFSMSSDSLGVLG